MGLYHASRRHFQILFFRNSWTELFVKSPRRKAKLFPTAWQLRVAQQHSNSLLLCSFIGPRLGPPRVPFWLSPESRYRMFRPFVCKATRRNSGYWISPSNHPQNITTKHYDVLVQHWLVSEVLDALRRLTSKHIKTLYIAYEHYFNHFITLRYHETSVRI